MIPGVRRHQIRLNQANGGAGSGGCVYKAGGTFSFFSGQIDLNQPDDYAPTAC